MFAPVERKEAILAKSYPRKLACSEFHLVNALLTLNQSYGGANSAGNPIGLKEFICKIYLQVTGSNYSPVPGEMN